MPDPISPSSHRVIELLQSGHPEEAERMLRADLNVAPANETALILLGISLQHQGRADEAVEAYGELTRLQPASSIHWNNLATALREAGQSQQAQAAYLRAVELKPDFMGALINLGLLCMEANDYQSARTWFLRAHEVQPASPEARIYAAQMCFTLDDRELAERLIEPRQQWTDLGSDLMLELGILIIHFGSVEEGIDIFDRLLHANPGDQRARAQLVMALERINRVAEARDVAARLPSADAIDDAATHEEVVHAHASLALRASDLAHARGLLESALGTNGARGSLMARAPLRENLYFSLAKTCDKQGDMDAAMAALAQAHALQIDLVRRSDPGLLSPDLQPLRTATIWIDAEARRGWPDLPAPDAADSPIFVVGFPRSGTTMLEQMLDAHPALQAMDERAFLQPVVERMSRFGYAYPHDLGRLDAGQCEELRQLYFELAAKVAPRAQGQRLVDKNPLNMLRLPLINRLFPNAPVILALRHPCDVILSNYMQHFRSNTFAVLCASLGSLARGYVTAMNFWMHHAPLLRPRLMELRYEDLLDDFPGKVAQIGEFLGLEDAAPLAGFHAHAREKGFISTPSYTQVIEPPNKKAVGRWKRYERWFEPILPVLQPIARHWDYVL